MLTPETVSTEVELLDVVWNLTVVYQYPWQESIRESVGEQSRLNLRSANVLTVTR